MQDNLLFFKGEEKAVVGTIWDRAPIFDSSLPKEKKEGLRWGLIGATLTLLALGYKARRVVREVLVEIRA